MTDPPTTTAPSVSVVIPLYGAHRGASTLRHVVAGWLAQEVSCEVIVATGTGVADTDRDIPGVFTVTAGNLESPGRLRNAAAACASGSWIYASDADVRPAWPWFLGHAMELAGDGGLAQPWMHRLVGSVTEISTGLRQGRCFHLVDEVGVARAMDDERLVWDGDVLMVDPPPSVLHQAPRSELRRRSPFHWGGLLVRRSVFEEAGGYCELYQGWGCEDDDLLAKIAALTPLTIGWAADPRLTCLHFEHPRPYDGSAYDRNKDLLARRLADGPATMARRDRAP